MAQVGIGDLEHGGLSVALSPVHQITQMLLAPGIAGEAIGLLSSVVPPARPGPDGRRSPRRPSPGSRPRAAPRMPHQLRSSSLGRCGPNAALWHDGSGANRTVQGLYWLYRILTLKIGADASGSGDQRSPTIGRFSCWRPARRRGRPGPGNPAGRRPGLPAAPAAGPESGRWWQRSAGRSGG
jgi:hypothetical protein